MHLSRGKNKHLLNLVNAFQKDGYEVRKITVKSDKIGMMAEHKTAANYETGKKKRAYYVEGTNYEMGYLLGLLAEKEIALMASDFTDRVVFSFIGSSVLERMKLIQEFFIFIVYELTKGVYRQLPHEIRDEIQGIHDGCKKFNPGTRVDMEHLIALNAGVDTLCSIIYTGDFLLKRMPVMEPSDFRIPVMCNGFSVFGSAAGGGHYFGRDFMFPTADVFQDTAALIIYNPDKLPDREVYPYVSVNAPGMAGSIAAMNIKRVGIGVDMSPAANCNTRNPGTNSLLLTRLCVQSGGSAEHMVDIMRKTQRGVSWNYIIADGTNDRACIVEAGSSDSSPDFVDFPDEAFKKVLPGADFIKSHRSAQFQDGLMVRWNDYKYPEEYLEYNYRLWKYYNRKHHADKEIHDDAFSERGYINRSIFEKNCPLTFYFAPQREKNNNIVITTNHYIIPEMRYYAMHPWTSMIVGDRINDIQWRYDELNNQIQNTLDRMGYIDYKAAKRLIDFLAPYGKFPMYYSGNPKSRDGKQIRIEGCTSIFDLKKGSVESHFGYYCDEWIRITLPNYFIYI